jgi:hypothetical protein
VTREEIEVHARFGFVAVMIEERRRVSENLEAALNMRHRRGKREMARQG